MTGRELQRWRKRRGITQRQAAELMGVTTTTWSRWESDTSLISKRVQLALEYLPVQKKK